MLTGFEAYSFFNLSIMQFITVSSILLSALSYLISPTTASGITLEYPTSLVNREFNPKYTGKLRVRALTPTYEPLPGTEFDQITAIYQYNNFYVGNIQQHPSAEPLIIEITMKNLSPEMGHGFNFKSRSARGGTSYQDLYAIKEGNNRLGMTMPHSVRKPQGATTYGWTIDEQGLIRYVDVRCISEPGEWNAKTRYG